ncbi:hypothetical protein K505DRAFT_136294 [Melanomma pulvis-pyrius CBS 109.77]|uniref:Uncharacterized protein n=1 Tax=Melanomma pulvis-pyrius CBS 109.77 TaxID=1314802 RepID=A0A6A6XQ22_9PLEO|nr:hypothetical protein K505DRAFT_136294 [Melanomma pulvis-pyrius CBS 109.77]
MPLLASHLVPPIVGKVLAPVPMQRPLSRPSKISLSQAHVMAFCVKIMEPHAFGTSPRFFARPTWSIILLPHFRDFVSLQPPFSCPRPRLRPRLPHGWADALSNTIAVLNTPRADDADPPRSRHNDRRYQIWTCLCPSAPTTGHFAVLCAPPRPPSTSTLVSSLGFA